MTIVFGQTYSVSSVYTRNGTTVESLILTSGEWTTSQKSSIKSQTLNDYPTVTFLDDATRTYNCHAYAWHLTEGNSNAVWINEYDAGFMPNVYRYWNDDSFIEVCNMSEADKVHYYNGDHSAIISQSVSGQFESK